MRLTAILITAALSQVTAKGLSQRVTYAGTNISIEKIFTVIHSQTGYRFFYNDLDLQRSKPVSVDWKSKPIEEALEESLHNQSLAFLIKGTTIFITSRPVQHNTSPPSAEDPGIDVTGRVIDSLGNPLPGASVTIKGSKKGTQTDATGHFVLRAIDKKAVLVISFTGYNSSEVPVRGRTGIEIMLSHIEDPLDAIQVIAYGTTTRRLNTGSVSSITAEQIARQPVTNVLGAMAGLAPGLSVMQGDGQAGGIYTVTIRGNNALGTSPAPLYIVDGVPFANTSVGGFPGTNNESSPLNTISPSDIERIDILKDADATAIYGSRGADGVILITTKRGKTGKGGLSLNTYTGFSQATRLMKWLNTRQYLEMRREAFRNDGITPTIYNAPDLLVWDTTRFTDWQKLLLGGTAHTQEAQLALTGGSEKTQFRLGATYHHETPIFASNPYSSKDYGYARGSFALSVTHSSKDNRFNLGTSVQYTVDKSNYTGSVYSEVPLPPNAPPPFDSQGKLNWGEGGVDFDNPFGGLLNTYNLKNNMLIASTDLRYAVLPGLSIKVNMGYNKLLNSSVQAFPKYAQNPSDNPYSMAYIWSDGQASWSAEPQLEYVRHSSIGKFSLLVGGTWQNRSTEDLRINASDYSSDNFVGSVTGAAIISTSKNSTDYRYNAFYGRINYNYKEKYLLNFTGRRDGSSRFGPGRQFSNFGAVGAAWIFNKEKWFDRYSGILSFGKVRGSYGVTGSDNIGDYQFVDTWYGYSNFGYDGLQGFVPNNLFNPDYAWETNRKLEAALELGFFKDRLLLSASYYRNRSGNQLINYTLPTQTGFSSVLQNFPAQVQNTGFELTISSTNIRTKRFSWTSTFNLSVNRNVLLSFPDLAASAYSTRFVVGQPITIQKYFHFKGVDPQTGLYTFNGTNFKNDRTVIKDAFGPPRFYGGIDNRVAWKGWELTLFVQFVRAYGTGYMNRLASYGAPGTMHNEPVYVLGRWQKPGDKSDIQRFGTAGAVNTAWSNFGRQSDASILSTTFVRFKNLSIAYNLPVALMRSVGMRNVRIYVQGQNLGIITGYKGADPESRGIGNPLQRVWTGGIQIDF